MEKVNAFEEMNRRSEWDRWFERAWRTAKYSINDRILRKLEEDKDIEDRQRREWDARHAGLVGPPEPQTQIDNAASLPESANASTPSPGPSSRKRRRLGRQRI